MRYLARSTSALLPCLAALSLVLGGCVPEDELEEGQSALEKSPAIYGFAINDQQTTLAVYGIDRTVQIRNLSDNELVAKLQVPDQAARSVAFVNRSDVLVGYVDGAVLLWSARNGQYIPRQIGRHSDIVKSCEMSLDKSFAVTADIGGGVTVWDVKDGWKRKAEFHVKGELSAARISPDGKAIAVACRSGQIQVWAIDEPTKPRTVKAHRKAVFDVAFSPNGDTIVSAGKSGAIRFWNWSDLSLQGQVDLAGEFAAHCYGVRGIRYSPDGSRIAAIAHLATTVLILDSSTRQIVQRISEHTNTVSEISFRSNKTLMTAGYDGQICTVSISSPKTGIARSGDTGAPRLTSNRESQD